MYKKSILLLCLVANLVFAEEKKDNPCEVEKGFWSCFIALPSIMGDGLVDVYNSDGYSKAWRTAINVKGIVLSGGLNRKFLIKTGDKNLDYATEQARSLKWERTKDTVGSLIGLYQPWGNIPGASKISGIAIEGLLDYVGEKILGQNDPYTQKILDDVKDIQAHISAYTNLYQDVFISKSSVDTLITSLHYVYTEGVKERNNRTQMLNMVSREIQSLTSHFGSAKTVSQNKDKSRQTIQENPYLAKGSKIIAAPVDIVLNWGSHPSDLDSHLTGPINATSAERFHISFNNKGSLENSPQVMLYRDDTSHKVGGSNSPEQTRINVTQLGVYNFYVHDFSNKGNSTSTALSQSGAVVSVHSAGNRQLPEGRNLGKKEAEYSVPQNRVGTVWHSFELDTRRNTIKPVGAFYPDESNIR